MQPDHATPDATALATLYRAYLDARYRWGVGGRWRTIAIGEPLPGLEAQFPQAHRFGVMSAWNPLSVRQPEAANRDADRRLEARINDHGWRHVPSFASAPNRSWREPSWLVVDIHPAELDALAREFGQLGTLCWERGLPVRLRMDAAKPAGIGPHPHVDWIQ